MYFRLFAFVLLILVCFTEKFIVQQSDSTIFYQKYSLFQTSTKMSKILLLQCKSKDLLSISITDPQQNAEMPRFPVFLENQTHSMNLQGYTFLQFCRFRMEVAKTPFNLKIFRLQQNQAIFQISDLNYPAGYFQVVTIDNSIKFGLGERFQRNFQTNNGMWSIWNRDRPWEIDQGSQHVSKQTYGHQPIYLAKQKLSNNYHLVYFKNTHGMNVEVKNQITIYHVIGGYIHFLLFTEKNPQALLKKYHSYIGAGHIPPFWAMGWHQCRWGYKNIGQLELVQKSYNDHKIPLDTLWSDLDYMDQKQDFTVNQRAFPLDRYKLLLKDLHYIPLIDAGVSLHTNLAMQQGKKMDVFMKKNGVPYIGSVWPGDVYFVDFLHPNSSQYWGKMLDMLYKKVQFSGVWLDMNQMSNFKGGFSRQIYQIQHNQQLSTMTVDSDVQHFNIYNSISPLLHKQVHAYYGHLESLATYKFLKSKGKRPFIITRSNSVGTGRYAGHWTGDNVATWEFLRLSISGNFLYQIFGIQMVGADICGFQNSTTQELCSRWMQLGSLYPFARNHNELNSRNQQPYSFGSTLLETSKLSLNQRYAILKQYYSIFVKSKGLGSIYRPLIFQFPEDKQCYNQTVLEQQFMIGEFLLSVPIVKQQTEQKIGYFPQKSTWYSLSGKQYKGNVKVQNKLPSAVPLFLRSGYILFMNDPQLRTRMIDNNFNLKIGLNQTSNKDFQANGFILSINDYQKSQIIDTCLNQDCFYQLKVTSNLSQVHKIKLQWIYRGPQFLDVGVNVKQLQMFWPDKTQLILLENLDLRIKGSGSHTFQWKTQNLRKQFKNI